MSAPWVNRKLMWSTGCILSYGNEDGAFHNGGGIKTTETVETNNIVRYGITCAYLYNCKLFSKELMLKLINPANIIETRCISNDADKILKNEDRIKYYLNELSDKTIPISDIPKEFEFAGPFLLNSGAIEKYKNEYFTNFKLYLNLLSNLDQSYNFVCTFGDSTTYNKEYACISKVKKITDYNPNIILLKLDNIRHWNILPKIKSIDLPFKSKNNKLIWRGASTGQYKLNNPRNLLVTKFQDHCNLNIDIKYSELVQEYKNLPDSSKYKFSTLTPKQQLESKFIISVEGNDVASNLKWLMLSNSCILMPNPTFVSWFMEDHLEPYIHYVPLSPDFEDLETQYEWCLNNPDKCETIAKNGTKYAEQFMDICNENYICKMVLETYHTKVKFTRA
jgi:hypothetical protein